MKHSSTIAAIKAPKKYKLKNQVNYFEIEKNHSPSTTNQMSAISCPFIIFRK
jgi:hypothetical protein